MHKSRRRDFLKAGMGAALAAGTWPLAMGKLAAAEPSANATTKSKVAAIRGKDLPARVGGNRNLRATVESQDQLELQSRLISAEPGGVVSLDADRVCAWLDDGRSC